MSGIIIPGMKAAAPPPPIRTFADFNPNKKFTACFVGGPGSGKSIGAMSIAAILEKPVFHAFFDGRLASVYKYYKRKAPQLLEKVDARKYTLDQYSKAATDIENAGNSGRYGAFILDPLIAYGNMALQYGIDQSGGRLMDPKGAKKLAVPQLQDYKTEAAALNRMMDFVQTVNAHVILCAHYFTIEEPDPMAPVNLTDEEKAAGVRSRMEAPHRLKHQLLVAGKQIAAGIPAFFDEVWFFDVAANPMTSKEPLRMLYTRPTNEYLFLKTSRPELPRRLDWSDKLLFPELKIALGDVDLPEEEATKDE